MSELWTIQFRPLKSNRPPEVRMRKALKYALGRQQLEAVALGGAAVRLLPVFDRCFRDDCSSDHLSDVPRVENAPESI